MACTAPRAYGVPLLRWDGRSLPPGGVEYAVVPALHYTTVAPIPAGASLPPPRRRYGKTARLDEEFVRLAAKVLGWAEPVEWLHRRGAGGSCLEEKPTSQA